MAARGISRVKVRECSICSAPIRYVSMNDDLFIDTNCYCTTYSTPPCRVGFDEAVEWIQMQNTEGERRRIASLFGVRL